MKLLKQLHMQGCDGDVRHLEFKRCYQDLKNQIDLGLLNGFGP